MCIKYSDEKISAKELEEDLITKSCIAGEKVGPVFLKIKKELYKVGLLAYGTIKTKLKDRIRNRMAKIQGKKKIRLCRSFKDVLNNIGDFRKHFNNEVFLDFTNIENNDNQIIIFYAEWGKQLLKKTPVTYIDGTFKKAPFPFKQVYIVMAEAAFSRAVPVAYVLMTERTDSAYATLFNRLSQNIGKDRSFHVNIDFELGVIKAIKRVFPPGYDRRLLLPLC